MKLLTSEELEVLEEAVGILFCYSNEGRKCKAIFYKAFRALYKATEKYKEMEKRLG